MESARAASAEASLRSDAAPVASKSPANFGFTLRPRVDPLDQRHWAEDRGLLPSATGSAEVAHGWVHGRVALRWHSFSQTAQSHPASGMGATSGSTREKSSESSREESQNPATCTTLETSDLRKNMHQSAVCDEAPSNDRSRGDQGPRSRRVGVDGIRPDELRDVLAIARELNLGPRGAGARAKR